MATVPGASVCTDAAYIAPLKRVAPAVLAVTLPRRSPALPSPLKLMLPPAVDVMARLLAPSSVLSKVTLPVVVDRDWSMTSETAFL
ncbi:hypothetical protein D3C86_1920140 [compost metagenome]